MNDTINNIEKKDNKNPPYKAYNENAGAISARFFWIPGLACLVIAILLFTIPGSPGSEWMASTGFSTTVQVNAIITFILGSYLAGNLLGNLVARPLYYLFCPTDRIIDEKELKTVIDQANKKFKTHFPDNDLSSMQSITLGDTTYPVDLLSISPQQLSGKATINKAYNQAVALLNHVSKEKEEISCTKKPQAIVPISSQFPIISNPSHDDNSGNTSTASDDDNLSQGVRRQSSRQ